MKTANSLSLFADHSRETSRRRLEGIPGAFWNHRRLTFVITQKWQIEAYELDDRHNLPALEQDSTHILALRIPGIDAKRPPKRQSPSQVSCLLCARLFVLRLLV